MDVFHTTIRLITFLLVVLEYQNNHESICNSVHPALLVLLIFEKLKLLLYTLIIDAFILRYTILLNYLFRHLLKQYDVVQNLTNFDN